MKTSPLSECRINTERQVEFDWAKAFAIVFMIVVHVYEEASTVLSSVTSPNTPWRMLIEFFGGTLCAPMFMFAMGVGLVYSEQYLSGKKLASKGRKLVLYALLLNATRGVVPTLLGMLIGENNAIDLLEAAINIDIFLFAGLALLLLSVLKRLHLSSVAILLISVSLSTIGVYMGNLPVYGLWTKYLLSPFLLTYEYACFPLLLWFFYPAAGICFGEMLQRVSELSKFYRRLFVIGTCGLALALMIMKLARIDVRTMFELANSNFYRQGPLHELFTISVIFMALSFYHVFSKLIRQPRVCAAVRFLGSRLTKLYVIQWELIIYLYCVTGFALGVVPLGEKAILPAAALIIVLSVLLCRWHDGLRRKKSNILRRKYHLH